MYGIKQSPRSWYKQLLEFFASINFHLSSADPCVFISSDPEWKCAVYVHVDDLCIMCQNTLRFKTLIKQRFEMEDIGECTYFLGMKLDRDLKSETITLSQEKYVDSMLEEYGMQDCQSTLTPMIPNSHLVPATDEERKEFEASGENYRRAVRLVKYLVLCTRPDLALVASQLAQFLDCPGTLHWSAFKRVLRYLKLTKNRVLVLGGPSLTLKAYLDSDHAGCPYTRRSVTGYCVCIGEGCVSWRARKQATVATSTTEAEYRAAYEATQELVWMRQLLSDVGRPQVKPSTLYCDNQGALALSKNPLYQTRSKHFDMVYHWIREKVNDSTIAPVYIETSKMLADFLTKAVHAPKFNFCAKGLKLLEPTPRGGSGGNYAS